MSPRTATGDACTSNGAGCVFLSSVDARGAGYPAMNAIAAAAPVIANTQCRTINAGC